MNLTNSENSSAHQVELGVTLLNQGRPREALSHFEHALHINQKNGLAYYNSGVAYHTLEDFTQAAANYQKAIECIPDLVVAYHNLGQAYTHQNDLLMAVDAYCKALQKDPADFKSAYNLSLLYRNLGRDQEAIGAIQTAIRANPSSSDAFCILGMIYHELDRYDEALISLEQALCINPLFSDALFQKGVVSLKSGQFENGLSQFNSALQSDSGHAPARWLYHLSLPMIYDDPDQIKTYRQIFMAKLDQLIESICLDTKERKAHALKGIQTTTNFYLQYQGFDDVVPQKKYGRFAHEIMAANFPQWVRKRKMPPLKQGQKVRIGYVSTFMYQHTVGTFLSGWLKSHTTSDYEIHCYYVGKKIDDLTRQLRGQSHRFHYFAGNMEAAARQIVSDDLHLLIYADIGMDPITTQLAALRLAPIQCKGWGHPVTTGLPTMDYYLSSELMEPHDAATHYSEVLVRLPNLALCYDPPALPEKPKARIKLGLPEKRFVFLSSQSIFKYLPQHDDIYPRIAKAVPQACFVFIRHQSEIATRRFQKRLQAAFAAFGLDADYFCHFSRRLAYDRFMSLNLAADVLLDTLEWSGGKTTLEALSCGLPVVTLPGRFMRGRHAYAMLQLMDINQTIADTKSTYCQIAARLANESDFFAHIKTLVISNRYKLFHDRTFMTALEGFFRGIISQKLANT